MSDRREVWRRLKAILVYACVPIIVSIVIIFMLSSVQFAIEHAPESWNLELPFVAFVMAWGAWICVPVAWFVGPLTFSLDSNSGSRHLLWRQAAIGCSIGAGLAGFIGLMLGAGVVFGLSVALVGAVLGIIHALGLRYALLWFGLIGTTVHTDPRTEW